MNKAQLIDAVADKTGGRTSATLAVEAVLDTIVRAVVGGEPVTITGFGTIKPVERPARVSRNPQNGDQVQVAATRVPRFVAGERFKALVSGRRDLPEDGNCIQKDPKTLRP